MNVNSQTSLFERTLHNGRNKIYTGYRTDTKKKTEITENHRKGNEWKINPLLQLEREDYDKLVDINPSSLGYVETFKKSCIIIDEGTVEIERTEIERSSKKF